LEGVGVRVLWGVLALLMAAVLSAAAGTGPAASGSPAPRAMAGQSGAGAAEEEPQLSSERSGAAPVGRASAREGAAGGDDRFARPWRPVPALLPFPEGRGVRWIASAIVPIGPGLAELCMLRC
jgi:hypothetical protein